MTSLFQTPHLRSRLLTIFMSVQPHLSVPIRLNFSYKTLSFHSSTSNQLTAFVWNTLPCFSPVENFYSSFNFQLRCQFLLKSFQPASYFSLSALILCLKIQYFKWLVYMSGFVSVYTLEGMDCFFFFFLTIYPQHLVQSRRSVYVCWMMNGWMMKRAPAALMTNLFPCLCSWESNII